MKWFLISSEDVENIRAFLTLGGNDAPAIQRAIRILDMGLHLTDCAPTDFPKPDELPDYNEQTS